MPQRLVVLPSSKKFLLTLVLLALGATFAHAAPAFVQRSSATPQSTAVASVTATFTAAQTAGNLNVVVVGWNDTQAVVTSVTDTKGNVYTRAVGPTLGAGVSQSIYYAMNIVAAAKGINKVTIAFSPAAAYPDIRILEYSGIDPTSPVDTFAAAVGNSTTTDSGSVPTTNANDLLFGANVVATVTSGPGPGFTSRIITTPDADIAEDRIVTTTGSYNATASLSSAGPWVMQMVAFRAASSVPDTTPPTAPANLAATAASASQINLSWTASTDNVGVTGYRVERCQGAGCSNFAQISSPSGTTFSDTGLPSSTSYSYRVRATDAAGNLSLYSNTATAQTQTVDTTPPTAPSNLAATALSSVQINLSWTASTDDVAVTGYRVERCQGAGCTTFVQIANPAGTTFSDTGLTASTSYNYRVLATDAAGNLSPYSNIATATTQGDTTPPTAPSNLAANATSASQINLSWTASTDNVGVTGYQLERCQGAGCSNFASIATPAGTTFNDTGLTSGTSYSYRVRATDAAGNLSPYSNTATGLTQTVDNTPPTDPTNLSANAVSSNQISLSWTASTDNVGVTGYRVERCQGAGCSNFAQITTPGGASFNDTGLASGTSYSYRVRATDAAGNLSNYSNVASATTTNTPPATPAFVQVNSATPQSAITSVSIPFTAAQGAGHLNVVAVGWNDTQAAVTSVTDTKGNVYALAIGPTPGAGLSQSIYYAKNIVAATAGANQVTVVFSPPAAYPDIRILEYSGIDPGIALDTTVAAIGNGTTSDSGPAVTTNANDLLFGANMVATTTSSAGAGYTSRIVTAPDGDIAEDRVVTAIGSYSASASLSSGAWVMQMVAFRAAGSPPPGPDTTPPSVSIASPAQGASVSGYVSVTANASDNIGVAGVQFKADSVNFGAEVTTPPYTVTWDTTALSAGTHTLTAVARDGAGNTATSAAVSVTVLSAATVGAWQGPFNLPMVPVHTMMMPNGKLLVFDGQDTFGQLAQVWDPSTNTFTPVTAPVNVFCSGHTSLPDGRVIVVGGHAGAHVGLTATSIFDPQTQSWTAGPDMVHPRWYPTSTVLPDGRVIVLSGETNCDGCYVTQPEIYNPISNSWSGMNSSANFSFAYYPHVFILPDGRVLVSSTAEAPIISRVLDLNTQTWTAIGTTALDGGSAVMYRPGKILKSGTSVDPDKAVRQSFANAYVLDMTQPSPAWRQVASMAFPRTFHTMVLLPDGNVFVEGGGRNTAAIDPTLAVFQAEIWSPTTETWTTVASASTPRLYHSEAMLMPDGRILVMGGGRFNNGTDPTDRLSSEYYLPPYLFKGARPTVTSAPSTLQYGQTFFVQTPDAAQIGSVALMRIGAVTHAFNMSQNYVPVTFQVVAGGLNVQAPANSNLAPPGYYMLFLVNTNGVPSVAPIVNLPVATSTQPPTAPSNLVATGGNGSASLSWSPSTGPNGVSGYSVYRATAPGVVPSASNRIAQPIGTSYVDSTFPSSGTYYYVVTARDPAGTESAPSNEVVITVTTDVSPPTDPANLTATAVSNSQINLSWTASTDNVGVAGYRVERCTGVGCSTFAQVATPSGNSFSDTGLTASTSYSYRVRAVDAAGNLSNYSNTASATTSATPPPVSNPTFVQVNSAVPQSTAVSSVSVTFTAAQTAGNLNVVVVGWNDTQAAVASITDTKGNVYTRAIGPTLGSGLSQSIYYAKNIVAATAGGNQVTVTFTPAAAYPDIRILEYSGIDSANPVDASAAAVGNSTSSSSGAAITTNATDLLFGANMVATLTSGAGTGFTSRVITSPDSDIAEDQVVSATGSYTATAPLSFGGPWIMQMVAFRAAGSPPPAAQTVEGGPPVP